MAGWARAGDYLLAADEVLRSRDLEIDPILSDGEAVSEAVGTVLREAGEFDRGNVVGKLVKGEKNAVAKAKGPFYAVYDVEVATGGDYQMDFKGPRDRKRHGRHPDQQSVDEGRTACCQQPGGLAGHGRVVGRWHFSLGNR